jgi:hypothetical protein
MRLGRQLLLTGFAGSALLATAGRAEGATDARFAGDDVRVTLDDAGLGRVEHAVSFLAGVPPKGFDLAGVEPEAVVDPEVVIVSPSGGEAALAALAAHVERKGDRALRVTFDVPPSRRPIARPAFVVRVRYTVDVVRTRELALDGAMWSLRWTATAAPEGYDAARVVFDLPAAPTEPRVLGTDGADGELVALRRAPQRDELELARPHVARGEAAEWGARVDPRAFPRVVDPSLRPPPVTPPEPARERGMGPWIVAAVVGVLFGALVRAKSARFARACEASGVAAKGLVAAVPPIARAWLAGGALAAGIVAEAAGSPAWGALGVVLAMILAAARAPSRPASPRGPGQWLALSAAEAFARDPGSDPMDAATLAGKATLLLATLGAVALGLALRPIDPSWLWLVPLDALVLLPLFATGSRVQLPPDRVRSPRRRLASLHRVLKREGALRVSPWARVPVGATVPDELRLLVLPRAPMPGVVGIELGVAWIATPTGYAPETEVLVRVREATAAASRMLSLGGRRLAVHGRKTDERVIRLVPALPTRAGAVALVRRLARELHDRRKSLPGIVWAGAERRVPVNERLRHPAAALLPA